ncbi:MAG: BrnA antitoxin family protein [Alphaproteobacteria bacterium]|nr:BrnA antitoxin family protein [Alphaproteobacteria bacterium]
MKRLKTKPKHISQEDWDAVDSPPLTTVQLRQMRPLREVMPDLAEAYRRSRGRPKIANPKTQVSLRLDTEIIETFKATGPGWQTRINDVLSNWAKRRKRAA